MAKRQTLHIWIAVLAILFSALAPAVSRALATADDSAVTMEICTANGYKIVKVPEVDNGKAPNFAKHGMEHCAFCTTHGGSYALTSPLSIVFAIDVGRDIYPPLFYAAPHALSVWSAASPRAPPFLA